jgi:plastocyanin
VTPGATVRFRNDDQADHTMTADGGAFDTGHVAPGKEAEIHAPTAPGTYAFHCEIHPSMTATLTVR